MRLQKSVNLQIFRGYKYFGALHLLNGWESIVATNISGLQIFRCAAPIVIKHRLFLYFSCTIIKFVLPLRAFYRHTIRIVYFLFT
jgi:hypothetical protein